MRLVDELEQIDLIAGQLYDLGKEMMAIYTKEYHGLICYVLQSAILLSDVYNEFCCKEQNT